MTASSREKTVGDIIFQMEDDLGDIERWALVLLDLGRCEDNPSRSGVYVVGDALERVTKSLREQWTEAFELSRPKEDAPPCA